MARYMITRNAGPESDARLQARVQKVVTRMINDKATAPPPLPPKTPTASPASMRNLRQIGEAGRPSPVSANAMQLAAAAVGQAQGYQEPQ